jgi:hypothetical protein
MNVLQRFLVGVLLVAACACALARTPVQPAGDPPATAHA